jgi:GT2 family glycosyltransferase
MTCHNRVTTTLRCLDSLFGQARTEASVGLFLVDAGSTDGTAEAVARSYPQVNVIRRGDDLYWCGGMRVALARAYEDDPDYYLWLNDDVVLDVGALANLLSTQASLDHRERPPAIVVGSTRDPTSGRVTYGGVTRSHPLRRLRYELVVPGEQPRRVETMNGNCVLVPREVVARIGTLASVYTHGLADYDYGHRAERAGCEVWIAPGTIGTCAHNDPVPDPLTFLDYGRRTTAPTTGLPPQEWTAFSRRWAGPLWLPYALSPYLLGWIRWLWRR